MKNNEESNNNISLDSIDDNIVITIEDLTPEYIDNLLDKRRERWLQALLNHP